jgi:hypothetical protein
MPPRLATVNDLAAYLDIEDRAGKDALLSRYLVAAERLAERYARRRFSPGLAGVGDADVDYTLTLTTFGKTQIRVPDLRAVTSMTHHGTFLDTDDWSVGYGMSGVSPATHIELYSTRPPDRYFGMVSRVGGHEPNDLVITGRWGFSPVPEDIVHAVCLMASKQWRRRDQGYADVTVDETTSYFRVAQSIPGDAKVILDTYKVHNLGIVGA